LATERQFGDFPEKFHDIESTLCKLVNGKKLKEAKTAEQEANIVTNRNARRVWF
jgi:hypothetical protein